MADDRSLDQLEARYASTAERVTELEARYLRLAAEYRDWRDRHGDEPVAVDDRGYRDAYSVLRGQLEVDVELFGLLQEMRALEGEIAHARASEFAEIQVIPGPSGQRRRRRTWPHISPIAIASGVLVLVVALVAAFAFARDSGETKSVSLAPAARQIARVTYRFESPTVNRHGNVCRKSVRIAVGDGAEYAGKAAEVRFRGRDIPRQYTRTYTVSERGGFTAAYETKRCAGSPTASVTVLDVGGITNFLVRP